MGAESLLMPVGGAECSEKAGGNGNLQEGS